MSERKAKHLGIKNTYLGELDKYTRALVNTLSLEEKKRLDNNEIVDKEEFSASKCPSCGYIIFLEKIFLVAIDPDDATEGYWTFTGQVHQTNKLESETFSIDIYCPKCNTKAVHYEGELEDI